MTEGKILETKKDKFRRLAEQRVNRALKELRLIANLANQKNYEYTEEEVRVILTALERELKLTRNAFVLQHREDFRL